MTQFTPAQVANHLGVAPSSVRRMAATFETVLGPLPRTPTGARLWPLAALRQLEAAHAALAAGAVHSLEAALVTVRDGAELPEVADLPGRSDGLAELLGGLLEEVRALRALTEAQGRELVALRTDLRALPAPAAHPPLAPSSAPGKPARLAASVPVLKVAALVVPRGRGWQPAKYAQAEKMLGEGTELHADERKVNYRTAAGSVMDYRTAEALVKLKVLVPA
ncbi:hypothetical protein [Deinococcus ficus]|uniref:hypothetical protein n=1 Tax=Deinococcus ficus TaxID=317577 RepID=UPI0003B48CB5|nr:hypothetical protein [Deinococcus ficus]